MFFLDLHLYKPTALSIVCLLDSNLDGLDIPLPDFQIGRDVAFSRVRDGNLFNHDATRQPIPPKDSGAAQDANVR